MCGNIHPIVFQDLLLKSMFPNHTGAHIQQLYRTLWSWQICSAVTSRACWVCYIISRLLFLYTSQLFQCCLSRTLDTLNHLWPPVWFHLGLQSGQALIGWLHTWHLVFLVLAFNPMLRDSVLTLFRSSLACQNLFRQQCNVTSKVQVCYHHWTYEPGFSFI